MGARLPKQLLEVAGKPVLQHTLEAFEAAAAVDRIVLVMAEGHHDAAWAIAKAANVTKLSAVIAGGTTRAASPSPPSAGPSPDKTPARTRNSSSMTPPACS
jgi:2-C-methyl-D-erythritol 4-phosphate cytidylyltransferase